MGLERVNSLIAVPSSPVMLRGEIWIVPEVLAAAGLSKSPEGLVELASFLGADLCFFHWEESLTSFDLKERVKLAHEVGLGCGLTVDGPFERLVQKKDLLLMLKVLAKSPVSFRDRLSEEMGKVADNFRQVEELGADLIILCEDLAYRSGLYCSPEIFREILLPFYGELIGQVPSVRPALGWHSDGNVSAILPDLVNCGFRFFSLESECLDLLSFKHSYGSRVSLIGGIRADWLALENLDQQMQQECLNEIEVLFSEGGLILASSCGLFHLNSLHMVREIYRLALQAFPDQT